ncbi:MAG TPA: protein kinase [Thermomicrobiales bacterium]|jgi:serine/threonine protein kinase
MGDAMGDASRLLLDRYRIEDMLGEGGLGTVYRAFDTLLKRPVAVKTLKSSISTDPEIRRSLQERFLREAEAGSRMGSNPNLVTIYDLVTDTDGTRCLICEFVAGGNLADLIRCGPLPTAALLRLTADAARDLQAAHDVGIVHRDVKPANIFIAQDGRAQVGDFGVAQIDDLSGRTRVGGGHPGTPLYMSPEQERMGAYLRPASDQYSLGLVLFEMMTGTIYKRVGEREAASLLDRQPMALAAIVRRMVADHPDDRFPSLSAVVEAVHQAERQVAAAQTTEPGARSPSDGSGAFEPGLPQPWLRDASIDDTMPRHTPRLSAQHATPPLSPMHKTPPAPPPPLNPSGSGVVRRRRVLVAVASLVTVALLIGVLASMRTSGDTGRGSPTPQIVSQSGPATTGPVATLKSGFPSAVAFANPSPTPTITPAPDIVPSATVPVIRPVSTATPIPPPTVTPPATRTPEPSPQPSATSRPPAPATVLAVTTAAQTFPQQQPTPSASGTSPAQVTKAAVTARAQSDMATTTLKQAHAAQPVMDYFTAINKHDLHAAFDTFDPANQQGWHDFTFFASEMGKVQHQDYQIISVFSSGTNENGVHVANPNVDNWLIVTQVKTLRMDGTMDERKVNFEVYDSELKIFSEDLIYTVLQ